MVATHADSADVGFDAAGKPVLLLTDGGLHRPGAERTVNLSASNGLYVVEEGGGGQPAFANRANASTWEAFFPVDINGGELLSGDQVRLQTQNRRNFVGAAGQGLASIDATATQAGANETFVLRRVDGAGSVRSGDGVRLQANNGSYVTPRGGDS